MNRTIWLAVLAVGVGVGMLTASTRWADAGQLRCPPSEVHLDEQGVARCGPGAELSATQQLTLGARLDLNRLSADELALVPGVGPQLSRELVTARTRLGRFHSWDEVDRVTGVGAARLAALQAKTEIK